MSDRKVPGLKIGPNGEKSMFTYYQEDAVSDGLPVGEKDIPEPIEVVHERLGGEDAETKLRDKFRKVTQAALEEYQRAVIEAAPEFAKWPALDNFRTATGHAAAEYVEAIAALRTGA